MCTCAHLVAYHIGAISVQKWNITISHIVGFSNHLCYSRNLLWQRRHILQYFLIQNFTVSNQNAFWFQEAKIVKSRQNLQQHLISAEHF